MVYDFSINLDSITTTDIQQVCIDYGDSTIDVLQSFNGVSSIDISHTYLSDGSYAVHATLLLTDGRVGFTEAIVDVSTNPPYGFPVTPLSVINTLVPNGHAQLYGVIADPNTNELLENGKIIIYGTTGNYTGSINDGRVRLTVTAPAVDEQWPVVLQREDGSTEQMPLLSMNVHQGDTVGTLRTSSGVESASISFTMRSGYPYAKIDVGPLGGNLTMVQESTGTNYTASEFSPANFWNFKLHHTASQPMVKEIRSKNTVNR